ncbi:MAG TPA: PHB depolymerase family esterase, partial [Polyangia bacterium]|nr:PHB depolymerase family esterase [Polyangia bacterium]
MKTFGWIGISAGVLLYAGCAGQGAGRGGDASVSVGSGGGSSLGGDTGPLGSGDSGSGGASGVIDAGAVGGSGGDASVDTPPDIDSGTASPDAAPQGPCTGGTLKPGNTTVTIQVGGDSRSYILHVPPKYDGKTRMPLVMNFHGKGGTAQGSLASAWSPKADAVGIVVMIPQGLYNSWNGGPAGCPTLVCCCQPAQDHNVDDVAFVRAAVAKTAQDGCIDLKRVYAVGLSNGGIMSQWLACDASDLVAAIAPASGPNLGDCKPSRPITVVQYRGTQDSEVLYNGGMSMPGGHVWPSAMADFTKWSDLDGCTDAPVPMPMHPLCQIRSKCAGG